MQGSKIVIGLIVAAIIWISWIAGSFAAAVIISFFAGAIITIGLSSMTSGRANQNARSAASRDKALDLREKMLTFREANQDRIVRDRVKQLATEQYLTWKARYEAEQAAKRQQQPRPQVAPVRPAMQWTEADL